MLLVFRAHTQTHTHTDTHTHCKSQISEGRQEQREAGRKKSNRRERGRERETDMIYNEIINLEKRPALYTINIVFKSTLLQILQSIWSEIIVLHNIQQKHLQNR